MTTPAPFARPVYEHPFFVRVCHWTSAVAIGVLIASGLLIFSVFPSFGAKLPERDLIDGVPQALTLGGWLGGALQWHFTFMWLFAGGGMAYVIAQIASGHFRTVLFNRRDLPGVWPMVRHYFFSEQHRRRPVNTTRFKSWPTPRRCSSVPFRCSPAR